MTVSRKRRSRQLGRIRIQGGENLDGFLGLCPVSSLVQAVFLPVALVRQAFLLFINSLSLTYTRSNWFSLVVVKSISI